MLFIVALALSMAAFIWYWHNVQRPRMEAARIKRANCPHERWRKMNAFNDPRLPIRTCEDCGVQEHLETPVPCPHCGENINDNSVKLRVN